MESGESLQDMITRFTTIVNELVSLGKIYTTEEHVDKVLRTLPRSWVTKVTAIREANDLTTMILDELLDNSIEDDKEDVALMAMEDSDSESDIDKREEQVQQLDSCTLAHKSEILKQSVTGNGKEKISGDQIRCDQDLKRLKDELFSEREKSRRINLELARTKYELEWANKWTLSSMIVTQLSNRTHNTKAGIGKVRGSKQHSI
ncbi:hypothetical protein KY290_027214 [Solanum tuberosum]|uniref:UBN2 domain-containing protein n=1 Tax=Solanum tuberosum TaxID=4113 RepID=A0ABQ7UG47_SOLTU|nr:hypothetical protein KY290_027214 [Solanum tuberosum]